MDLLRPIFVIGNPRSGTTLLRLILNNHEEICIPPECGFIQWWHQKYADWQVTDNDDKLEEFVKDILSSKKMETWGLDKSELFTFLKTKKAKSYAEITAMVCEFFAQSKGRKSSRWGDKNNYYINHLPLIHEIYPEAIFIFIIRDGRDVACSYRKIKDSGSKATYVPKLPYEIEAIAEEWSQNNLGAISFFEKNTTKDRFIFTRYEDLLNAPEEESKRLCSFLGLPFSEKMLKYYEDNQKKSVEPKEFLDWKQKTLSPIDQKNMGKYKNLLSPDEILKFQTISGKLMKRFNYV